VGQILHRNATTTDAVGRGTLPSQPDRFKISSNPPLGRLGLDRRCHTTFNVKNVKPAISMTYYSARYLINDTLLDNIAHLPTSYLRIVS
jgi:hypothetical protein